MPLETTREFFEIASRHGMLPSDTVRDLQLEAEQRQLDGSTLVLQKGLMTALDVDIVETLQRSAEAVPGYEIKSLVGRGGMGVVYKARQVTLDRVVALKMVLVGYGSNPTMLARFEQEARTVGRLVHPHIVTAFDFGRHEGRLFFAMEYVEGEDAEKYLNRMHPLSEALVWNLIRQAAAGLAHAADLGIVHRDIKPANLLLVTAPKGLPVPIGAPMVKIADFGLAFLSSEMAERTRLTSEQSTLGSPNYMAPEQLNSGSTVDHRADIYALGATAFHLLAGRPPFDGDSVLKIISQKLKNEVPSLEKARADISRDGNRLIQDMLAPDAKNRVGTYAELLNRIDTLPMLNSGLPTIRLSATPTEASPSQRRRPLPRFAIPAILAAMLGCLVGMLLISRPSTVPPQPSVTLRPTGWSAELFNGQSLKGWRPMSGSWIADTDDEGGSILSGTNGEIARNLIKPAAPDRATRLVCFRLTMSVRLHLASAIEVQFNLQSSGARDILRLTSDHIVVGHRRSEHEKQAPSGAVQAFTIGNELLHEVRLERTSTSWNLFVDDVAAGSVPVVDGNELSEFRLAVDGGPAQFGDLFVEELVEIRPNP